MSRVRAVQDGLTSTLATLLDIADRLVDAIGEEVHPSGWATAVDDFHTILVELATVAAAIQDRVDGWERANPDADRCALASAGEATEALGETGDAIAEAATAVSAAWHALTRVRPPAPG